jgi:hypothetical protein
MAAAARAMARASAAQPAAPAGGPRAAGPSVPQKLSVAGIDADGVTTNLSFIPPNS